MVRLLVEQWVTLVKGEIMPTKRKQKYSFNPFDHSWLGGNLEFNPAGAWDAWNRERKRKQEMELIEKLRAKYNSPEAQNKRLGILEHDEGGEYTDEENAVLLKIVKEREGDSTDFETVRAEPQFGGDEVSEELDQYKSYSDPEDTTLEMLADERRRDNLAQQYEQYRTPDNSVDTSMISKDSSKSKMSPNQKVAMIGLLKDFMTPQEDDPVPQVRGAGISRGGGTPFPSLLAKRQKPPRYTPKGLI